MVKHLPATSISRRHVLRCLTSTAAATVLCRGRAVHADDGWQSLFDGRSLGQWKPTEFGGEGAVTVDDGRIVLAMGGNLTGVTWTGEVPTGDYEIELQAMRLAGSDFFCGLTFPVHTVHCSLIVGGWGGALVGLSSLNFHDAADNSTTTSRHFDNARWYTIRVRVTGPRIQAWIDDEPVVDVDTTGKRVSVRAEVFESRPLGIAAWQTKAALRNVRLRTVLAG